jgi:xylulokinase
MLGKHAAQLGVKTKQIRATGGGANSKLWRQIMADIFNAEVVTLTVGEGAAYGAALQALWCWKLQRGEKARIADITDEFVALNRSETARPIAKNVAAYRELQNLQDAASRSLRGVFSQHRRFVLGKS